MPTALIVEDEPEANKLLGMLIKLRGYRSTPAFDGREALLQLGRFSPDVVFLDLMLPDVSGYEVCRALKSTRATCLIPTIVVSARIAHRNRADSFRAGADEFVAKPYTPEQIFAALSHAESLRAQAGLDRIAGTARLDNQEDDASARDLARLRSLVLARASLPEPEAAELVSLVAAAEAEINDWICTHPERGPTSVDYELSPSGLTLAFRGIDWFNPPDGPLAVGLDRFDEATVERDANRLTLRKRWG